VLGALVSLNAQPSPTLKIVVVEGEGGVNIIQQKTAVRPLIEVRDRNNVPVAGASVTFTISGGGGHAAAFAGGAQTLTVTTNAAGQAAASGFNALSSGAFQIQVQAAYQGQIATAAISQTNFATAAAAAQAGTAAGGGGGATGGAASGAAGGGGGISGTTIGIVGGAVAGGAVAATQLSGGNDSNSDSATQSDANSFDGYDGSFSGQLSLNSEFTPTVGPNSNCTFTSTLTGTLRLELKQDGTGAGSMEGTSTQTAASSTCILDSTPHGLSLLREQTPVTGGPSALQFTATLSGSLQIQTWRFSGTLIGNTITGTLSYTVAPASGANPRYTGSTSMPITLTGPRR
jgi:hypothetical protein